MLTEYPTPGPQRHGATGLQHARGAGPKAIHVEPVGCCSSAEQVDTAVGDDGRRPSLTRTEVFGGRKLEADPGLTRLCGRRAEGRPRYAEHTLRWVKTDGISKMGCQASDGFAGPAADIHDGVELSAGGGVMVDDGLEELRGISVARGSVRFALLLGVLPERLLFSCHDEEALNLLEIRFSRYTGVQSNREKERRTRREWFNRSESTK